MEGIYGVGYGGFSCQGARTLVSSLKTAGWNLLRVLSYRTNRVVSLWNKNCPVFQKFGNVIYSPIRKGVSIWKHCNEHHRNTIDAYLQDNIQTPHFQHTSCKLNILDNRRSRAADTLAHIHHSSRFEEYKAYLTIFTTSPCFLWSCNIGN